MNFIMIGLLLREALDRLRVRLNISCYYYYYYYNSAQAYLVMLARWHCTSYDRFRPSVCPSVCPSQSSYDHAVFTGG